MGDIVQERVEIERPERFEQLRRIMVVDDNVDAAESLAMLLELMDYEARVAFSGADALAVAEEFRPEVVFLDIGLPGMNGYEVAAELRRRGFTNAYLVALTGWGADDDRRRAQEAGFNLHLTKPVEAEQVEELLKKACKTARSNA